MESWKNTRQKTFIVVLNIIAFVVMALLVRFNVNNGFAKAEEVNFDVPTDGLSFDLLASPEEIKVKAGETVEISLDLSKINVGENGLNSIVGYLKYDESLFDSMSFKGSEIKTSDGKNQDEIKWNVELNQIKDSDLYGKFCIYTMKEGVTENQNVAKVCLKLKKDLKPQTTKVYFNNLESSDGDIEVKEEDRVVTIIIYEDVPEEPAPEEPAPEEPAPEEPTPEKPQEQKPTISNPVVSEPQKDVEKPMSPQTGDTNIILAIVILVLTILMDVFFVYVSKRNQYKESNDKSNIKKQEKKFLSLFLVMVIGVSCLHSIVNAEDQLEDIMKILDIKQTWLNSENYLVTDSVVSRIAPGTQFKDISDKFNKEVSVSRVKMSVSADESEEIEDETSEENDNEVNEESNNENNEEINETESNQSQNNMQDELNDMYNKLTGDIETELNKINDDDIITTGMQMTVATPGNTDADGDKKYAISVWGDTNEDGKSNQVELTSIIRNVVNKEKWKLSGVRGISADLNIDNNINEDDVNLSVRYIVYGEMNIPGFEQVEEPKIEIVSGDFSDEENAYISEIQIKITENAENAQNTKYKVESATEEVTPYTEISREELNAEGKAETVIKISENGVYKISAYTTGELGNRSEIPYIIVEKTYGKYGYKINYYYQNELKNTDSGRAKLYSKIDVTPKKEDGDYVLDPDKGEGDYVGTEGLPITISDDETKNVANIYYILPGNFYNISGEVIGGNGKISDITETVYQGKNSTKEIKFIPDDGYKVKQILKYTSDTYETAEEIKANGQQEDVTVNAKRVDKSTVMTLDKFENVQGNIHVTVEFEKRIVVAKIVGIPDDIEQDIKGANGKNILNQEYYTLEDAISDAQIANNASGKDDKMVDIILLADIDDESNIVEKNNNITIDLQGHVINSNAETQGNQVNATLVVKDANVIVKDTSDKETGKINSKNGSGVYIEKTGTFTVGVDEAPISKASPVIQGKIYGVDKEIDENAEEVEDEIYGGKYKPGGIFNFYDGKIIGGTLAFNPSRVDDTPTLYNASVTTNAETGNYEATLNIVSEIEAVIGKRRYTKLSYAIDAANNTVGQPGEQIEIKIVKPVTTSIDTTNNKDYRAVVDSSKNIKLDLNGYTLTTNADDCVIKNYGTLEIYDSSEKIDEETNDIIPGTGLLVCTTSSAAILNGIDENGNVGKLTITSGNYKFDRTNGNVILNKGGQLFVNGGKINQNYDGTFGIRNAVDGTVYGNAVITGGNIVSRSPAFVNEENATMLITGGSFEATYYECIDNYSKLTIGENENSNISIKATGNSDYSVGVRNRRIGQITINGGTFYGRRSAVYNYDTDADDTELITINNGDFSASDYGAIYNNTGKTIINNANISSAQYGLRVWNGTIEVNNINMANVDANNVPTVNNGIYRRDGSGKIVFNNGKILTRTHAVYAYDNYGMIEINGGELSNYNNAGNQPTVYLEGAGNGTFKMTDGIIKGPWIGIQTGTNETIVVTGGRIISDNATSIYSTSYGKIIVGENDETISTELPILSGKNIVIDSRGGEFEFYDGVLIGTENDIIISDINKIPENKEIVKEIVNGRQYVTIGMPTIPVARIPESDNPNVTGIDTQLYTRKNGYYEFMTLNAAVEASRVNGKTEIEIIENDLWIYRPIVVDENKDITIDFKGNTTYALCAGDIITNKGKLKLINTNRGDELNIISRKSLSIKNKENAVLDLDNISINYMTWSSSSGNIIDNYGILNITNTDYYANSTEGYSLNKYQVYNGTTGILNIENSNIVGNSIWYIVNDGADKQENGEKINSANIVNSKIGDNNSGRNYGIYNNGGGTLVVDNSKVYMYNNSANLNGIFKVINDSVLQCPSGKVALSNESDGTVIIENSIIMGRLTNTSGTLRGCIYIKGDKNENGEERTKVSSSQYSTITNTKTGYVEISGGLVSGSYWNSDVFYDVRVGVIDNNGELKISGGRVESISGNSFPIYNKGSITIAGDNAEVYSNVADAIKNEGKITILGGTVRSDIYCGIWDTTENAEIYISTDADYEGKEPYIHGATTGIHNIGKLIIGIEDQKVKYRPVIYGGTTGIVNSKTFEFYDGIINAKTGNILSGTISKIEEDHQNVVYSGETTFNDGTAEKYKVAAGRDIAVIEQISVARVESTGELFPSLNKAYAATDETDTITMIADYAHVATRDVVEIDEGKNITLNLNGYNIVSAKPKTIINNGTLTVKGTRTEKVQSEDGETDKIITGGFTGTIDTLIENNGTCTIESGNFGISVGGNSSKSYDLIKNTGDLNVKSGNLYTSGAYSYVIDNAGGNLVIENGNFTANGDYSTVIYNGKKSSEADAKTGEITIKTGIFKAKQYNSVTIHNVAGNIEVLGDKDNLKKTVFNGSSNRNIVNAGANPTAITINNAIVCNRSDNNEDSYSGEIAIDNISSGTVTVNNVIIPAALRNANGIMNVNDITMINNAGITNGIGQFNINSGTISGSDRFLVSNNGGELNIKGLDGKQVNIEGLYWRSYPFDGSGALINAGGANAKVNIQGNVNLEFNGPSDSSVIDMSNGILTIGDPNNITNDVKIKGDAYAISKSLAGTYAGNSTSARVNYYGGTICGQSEAVLAYIDDIPDGYQIRRTRTNQSIRGSTISCDTYEIVKDEYVAQVGDNQYTSIQQAIDENNNATIVVQKNLVFASEDVIEIPAEKTITLDLNGKSIKLHNRNHGQWLTNKGTFIITDSTESKAGSINGYADVVIRNEGNFVLENGKISITQDNINMRNGKTIYNVGNGTVKINGGLLYRALEGSTDIRTDGYIIYSENENIIEVTGGEINGSVIRDNGLFGIYTQNVNSKVKVTGGKVNNVYANIGGTVEASGTANIDLIHVSKGNNAENKITVSDSELGSPIVGSIEAGCNTFIEGGQIGRLSGDSSKMVTITGGKITGQVIYWGTVEAQAGTNMEMSSGGISYCENVNIYDGAIIKTNSNPAIVRCTNVTITGGTVEGGIQQNDGTLRITGETASVTGNEYGILSQGGSTIITNGSINAKSGNGIRIENGTVTLGVDNGNEEKPNQETPAVTGSSYGVNRTGGTFRFYDGILTGGTNALYGSVGATPGDYSVIYKSTDHKVAVLGVDATIEQVATVGGTNYDDLQSAINAADNQTVVLAKDIKTETQLTVAAGKNVTIDLNGFTITGIIQDKALIVNNGSLTIVDSMTATDTQYARVDNRADVAIENNGTLTLGANDGNVDINSPRVVGKDNAVNNGGIINVYDGQICGSEGSEIITGSGTINVVDGYDFSKSGAGYVLTVK